MNEKALDSNSKKPSMHGKSKTLPKNWSYVKNKVNDMETYVVTKISQLIYMVNETYIPQKVSFESGIMCKGGDLKKKRDEVSKATLN